MIDPNDIFSTNLKLEHMVFELELLSIEFSSFPK